MRRMMLITLLAVAVPLGLVSASSGIDRGAVNRQLTELYREFNNNLTGLSFLFERLSVIDGLLTDGKLAGTYTKTGTVNELRLQLNSLSFNQDDALRPTVDLDTRFDIDMVKAAGQDSLNEFGPTSREFVEEFLADFLEEYGDAATVTGEVTKEIYDSNNNLVEVAFEVAVDVDMTKLPDGVTANDVFIISGRGEFSATRQGGQLSFQLTLNGSSDEYTEYGSFVGRVLQDLAVGRSETVDGYLEFLRDLDFLIESIVNEDATQN